MTDMIAATAERLVREHRDRTPFHTLAGLDDVESAYGVQKAYVAAISAGRKAACYKIGLTSRRIQAMGSIDSPVAGVISADSVMGSGALLHRSAYHHLGLEFEICVRLGADLAPRSAPVGRDEAAAAVDALCAAIEIIDDRNADYAGGIDGKSLIADNSWNAGVVLGVFVSPPERMENVEGVALQDGVEIGRGRGADALGHPLEPLTWLANHLWAQGGMLRKGDIVMTGSIVTTRFPDAASNYHFDISGIGGVSAAVI